MIEIDNISKRMGDKILFENFSVEIPDKAFAIITGDSGTGKTTLLNMIGAIEKYDSGDIRINNKSIKAYSKRKLFREEVGFLFQNFALIENKTVEENLSLVMDWDKKSDKIQESLNIVGLPNIRKKKVYQLSGGEQQRVALARLMLKKCNIVLADEPTGSLDKTNSSLVMSLLHYLNEQGKTIVMVTHDLSLLEEGTMTIKI